MQFDISVSQASYYSTSILVYSWEITNNFIKVNELRERGSDVKDYKIRLESIDFNMKRRCKALTFLLLSDDM